MGASGIFGDGDDPLISKSRFEAPFITALTSRPRLTAIQAAKKPTLYQYTSCELTAPAQAVNDIGRG